MPALSGFLYKLKTPNVVSVAEQTTLPNLTAFNDIGGFQSNTMSGSASEIDVTTKSSGENKELLNKRGIVSLEFSGEGVAQDTDTHKSLAISFLSQKLRWFLVEREDGRKFISRFKITSYSVSATHDGPQTFSISLMSSGAIYIRDTSGFSYDTQTDRITAFASQVSPFNYFLFNSARYFPSQIPVKGSARTTALRSFVTNLATPVNSRKVSGTPTTAINLTGPVPAVATDHTLTFAINPNAYKGYSRNTSGLLNTSTGTLVPNIANLNELLANASNVFASVTASNKLWLSEGASLTIGSNSYTFGGDYNDSNNSAKMIDKDGNEVRGDSIRVTGTGDTWDQAIARDTLAFKWQIKNQYTFPVLLLEKSVLQGKQLQVLDAIDSDITDRLVFVGEKKDSTNVDWNSYYIDIPLHDNETSDIKVQIGD